MKRLFQLPKYILTGLHYCLSGPFHGAKPRLLMLLVTSRCNSRCIMCKSWQRETPDGELSTSDIQRVFSEPFFNKLEVIIISGGEPILRDDLGSIVKIIHKSCPRLKDIWLSSNGFAPSLLKKRVLEIINVVGKQNAHMLTFNISIDGIGETHDKIRGVKGGFDRSLESIRTLNSIKKNYPINVTINTVIQPYNLLQLEEIRLLGFRNNITTTFSPLIDDAYFASSNLSNRLAFTNVQLNKLKDFIIDNYGHSSDSTSIFWSMYLSMLNGNKRTLPCAFDRYAFVIEPSGETRACTMAEWTTVGNIKNTSLYDIQSSKNTKLVRSRLKKEICPKCTNYCTTDFALQKQFFTYAYYYFKRRFFPFLNTFRLRFKNNFTK